MPGDNRERQADLQALRRYLRDLTRWAEAMPADFDANEVGLPVGIRDPETRLAVERLRRAMREILDERHHLHLGLNALHDGVAVFDSKLELVTANRSFRSFFSAVLFSARGIPFNRFADIALTGGLVEAGSFSISDFRAWLLDGGGHSRVIRLPDGRHLRFMMPRSAHGGLAVLACDITQNVAREKQLEDARMKAQAAATSRASFLANISHEMRTPLNGIMAMAELLADAGLPAEQTLFADTIRNSAEALLGLINNVLDFARADGREPALTHAAFDLPAMAQAVMALTAPLADAKGLTTALHIDPAIGLRMGDGARLRQVLLNLVGNAVKFSQHGSITVTLMPEARSGGVVILVSDQGSGIADDEIDAIFREFVRAGDSDRQAVAGTGLGLAISAQIVAAMGGSIWVDSRPGEGSTFALRLPGLVAAESPDRPPQPEPPGPGRLRILAADDNATNRLVLQKLLAPLPVDLCLVSNGAEAVAAWQEQHPQLVFMDISMPVMDGYAAARAIRAAERAKGAPPTPIVALTAYSDAETRDGILAAGMTAILPKPVSRAALTEQIRRHIPQAAAVMP